MARAPFTLDDLPARLRALVQLCPAKGCWLWIGSTSGTGRGGGYGRVKWQGVTQAAHKVVWLVSGGRLLRAGEQLDHTCTVRRCCNPAHLSPLFQKRNMKLAYSRRRAAFTAEAAE
ncbi:MAG: bacteriophage protein [Xanthobacteraceae bacterium]|jgi:hypothetical protein|nr:bacteriophage protein [Xanthobacteraceae bacterium]